MLRLLLPTFVVIVCLCGCGRTSPTTAVPAIQTPTASVLERTACPQDTICTLKNGQREVASFDGYHDGKDSPIFRARTEALAQRTCGLENKDMQVLNVRVEDVPIRNNTTWSTMHLQFACSGPKPTSPTAAEQLVSEDSARRNAEKIAAQEAYKQVRDDLIAERAADPAHQKELTLRAIEDARTYRFVVSFNSFGSGPNPSDGGAFRAILDDQERVFGHAFKHRDTAWGREGESSLCFSLDELDAQEQRQFVDAFTTRFRTSSASIGQNAKCPRRPYSESEEVYKILCERDRNYC